MFFLLALSGVEKLRQDYLLKMHYTITIISFAKGEKMQQSCNVTVESYSCVNIRLKN